MVALIKTYQRTEGLRAIAPVNAKASTADLAPIAQGVSQVGDTAFEVQDEIDTATAKVADNQYADLIRSTLYDDQTGFMYTQGGTSVAQRESVGERLETEQKRILEGLHPSARSRAGASLTARYQRSLQQVDQHTSTQRGVYLNGASEARVASSISDAIYNPDQITQSLSINRQEITDMAAREGWAPEVTALKLKEGETKIHSGIIGRVATVDPVQALEYLRENKDKMDGSEVARLEAALVPMARERRGRDAGFAAASGGTKFLSLVDRHEGGGDYSTLFSHSQKSGGKFAHVDVTKMSIADVIEFSRPDGEYGQWVKGELGRTGQEERVATPMGRFQIVGTTLRGAVRELGLDINSKFDAKTQNRIANHLALKRVQASGTAAGKRAGLRAEWEGFKHVSDADLDTVIADLQGGGGGIDSILAIQDPDEQAAAMRSYNMVTGAKEKEKRGLADAAVEDASDLIIRGGSLSSLSIEQIDALGPQGHTSMMAYEAALARGIPIETDDTLYVELFDDVANDPQKMIEANPAVWRDKLSDGDFKYFVKMRADLIAGNKPKASDVPGISAIRTASSTALKAAGLNEDFEAVSAFESGMLRWSSEFTQTEGRAPSPTEINDKVNEMLVPVVINPKGLKRSGALGFIWDSGKVDAPQFQVDWEGSGQTADDDLTPEDIRDGRLKIDGTKIENQTIEWFAQAFQDRFKRTPSVSELVEGIIASGAYK
tara:strand:- start:3141 stop:5297 length:2157 start_codon:yes stop_codon:yes gene_type:complete